MFSIQFRIAAIIVVLAAFFANATSASENPGPTPGSLVPAVPPPQPVAPPPPPTISPSPLPTLPPRAPSPVPTVAPMVRNVPQLGPSATIVLPNAASTVSRCVNGIFQLVSLSQDQLAQVTVQYPASQAGEVLRVEALDGGLLGAAVAATTQPYRVFNMVSVPSKRVDTGTISAAGTFTFLFKTGHPPGLYQIRIRQPAQLLGLQFWVEDPQHPANNPPALRPVTGAPTQPPI